MKINTKFSLGDTVYFMRDNKVKIGHICKIKVEYFEPNWYSENYYLKEDNGLNPPCFNKSELFSTKEELIEQL